jgi:hypothetical protein
VSAYGDVPSYRRREEEADGLSLIVSARNRGFNRFPVTTEMRQHDR